MKTLGKILKHALILASFLLVGVAVAVAWFLLQSDEFLRTELLRQLAILLPDAEVSIDRAQYDFHGRVRVTNFTLRLPGETDPALIVPEVVISLDRQALHERQQLLLQQIRFSQPQVRALRDEVGQWNWSQLTINRPEGNRPLPELEISHATIDLALLDVQAASTFLWHIEDVHMHAEPDSQRSFAVNLSARSDLTGLVTAHGTVPLEPAAWQMQADVQRLSVDATTLQLAQRIIPDLPQRLQAGHRWLHEKVPAANTPEALARRSSSPLDLGLNLVTSVNVQARQSDPDTPPEFLLNAAVQDGQLTHEVVPYPLRGLQGSITTNGSQVVIRGLKAINGRTQLTIDGRADRAGTVDLSLKAVKLPIDAATVDRLPEALKKIAESLALSGYCDGTARATRTAGQPWVFSADASLSEGRVTHERFPYPVHDVQGTLSWHDDVVQLHGTGRAGQTLVSLVGTVRNPGPEAEALYDIRADDVPIDDALIAASPTQVRQTLTALRLRGQGNAWLRVIRPVGLDQKHQFELRTIVRGASLQFTGFPYAVTDLSGKVNWLGDLITFHDLKGQHDGAILTGSGQYNRTQEPGRLTLDVSVTNGAVDRALYTALAPHLQEVWDAFNPRGQIDLTTHVEWTPGQAARVDVPNLTLTDGAFQMRDFPFPFQDVAGEFAYDFERNRVTIQTLSARHDDTQVRATGHAHCITPWTVTLDSLHVDDLSPTPAFRRTLAGPLKQVVDTLNPVGRFSFDGPVTFYGPEQLNGPVQAEWKLKVHLAGCSLNAGLRIDDVHGRVDVEGQWDGVNAALDGRMDLDSLAVFVDHRITRVEGPFRLRDQRLVVGSAQLARPVPPDAAFAIAPTARVIGTAYQGDAKLDAIVDLTGDVSYTAHLELNGASLERYALQHLRGHTNVRGLMNGWMDLRGTGYSASALVGDGQLQISPAALYELPVFLQIFQLPQFQPVNRSAFNYANFLFGVRNERFEFQSIDLVGPSLSLRGRGLVRFDGKVNLDFFTMQPRNAVPIPGLREIVGLVNQVSQGWLAVEVRGSIASPEARVVPFPELDAALKQFLGAFEPRANGPPPTFRNAPRNTEGDRSPRR